MFVRAVELAANFTWPVVISTRRQSGAVDTAIGTIVVVNSDGWFVTAAHLLDISKAADADAPKVVAYQNALGAVEATAGLTPKQRRQRTARIKQDPQWITNISHWWGRDGIGVPGLLEVDALADLDVGKLEPFDPSWVPVYPRFKAGAGELPSGASLCRLGFPFHEVKSTFDQTTGSFTLAPEAVPLPRFPNEGILTRIVMLKDPASGRTVRFLETSSPGLRGQSGGPIFDVEGAIWGIQSRTVNFPLGFSPEVSLPGGRTVTEHQFMNVGWGAHVNEVARVLTKVGVSPSLA